MEFLKQIEKERRVTDAGASKGPAKHAVHDEQPSPSTAAGYAALRSVKRPHTDTNDLRFGEWKERGSRSGHKLPICPPERTQRNAPEFCGSPQDGAFERTQKHVLSISEEE
jgi:hypothetical protein